MNPNQKWEYTSIGSSNFEAPEIKQLGEEGWELVCMMTIVMQQNRLTPPVSMPIFMFKRIIHEDNIPLLRDNPSKVTS